MKYIGHTEKQHHSPRTGVLLINLGTPEAPTPKAVRRYLAEFLSDARVVEIPKLIWMLILYGVILPLRPRKTAENYQKIWTDQGSPLLVNSQALASALQTSLVNSGHDVKVVLGMRYGNPSIAQALAELHASGISKLMCIPMYPQYAASTTGTAFDAVSEILKQWRWVPEVHFQNHYADHPLYIDALVNSINAHWHTHGRGDRLLFSFHGLPQRCLNQGDPYYCYCQKTARLVSEQLDLNPQAYQVVFQSRFGREPWLQPYCDKTLEALPKEGVKTIDIICPGFSADCLETLEEIQMTNQAIFIEAGGSAYRYIPALNATEGQVALYQNLIQSQM